MKIKLFCNYTTSEELLKRFKKNYTITDDILQFTLGEDYDVAVVFNKTDNIIKDDCKLITIIQEPSWSPVHSFGNTFLLDSDILVVHDKQLFEKTYKIKLGGEVIEMPSLMFYHDHVEKEFYNGTEKVKKKKKLSMVVSGIHLAYGNYVKRLELVDKLLKSDIDIDIYGRGLKIEDKRYKGPIENKFSALLPYEYSIAIENSCEKNYVTEKFIDPVLCYTTPIYYGAPNISEIYSDHSFVSIDLDSPTVIDDIKNIISKPRPTQNLIELKEAKDYYFFEYNVYRILKNILC